MKRFCCLSSFLLWSVLSFSYCQAMLLPGNFWPNPTFEEGTDLDSPGSGLPEGWNRGGADVRICQVSTAGAVSGSHSLAVVDDEANGFGGWYRVVSLEGNAHPGERLDLQWFELFNTTGDMRFAVLFFKVGGALILQREFFVTGQSEGWAGTVEASPFVHRFEQLTVPEEAASMLISIVSGGATDAKGVMLVDDLSVRVYPPDRDTDGDLATDGEEELAGTDPLDPRSVLALSAILSEGGKPAVQWSTVALMTYTLYSSNAPEGDYLPVAGAENLKSADGKPLTIEIPEVAVSRQRFYRVQLVLEIPTGISAEP